MLLHPLQTMNTKLSVLINKKRADLDERDPEFFDSPNEDESKEEDESLFDSGDDSYYEW